MRKPKIISLCCGAGIGELGFREHFDTALAVDSWFRACCSFTANFPGVPVRHGDAADETLVKWAADRFAGIDGIVATPPCPSFSVANSCGRPDDPRSLVYLSPLRWVEAMRPRFYVCENVNAIRRSPYLGSAIGSLQRLGYRCATWILDAADYGTPQHRARLFLVAMLDREPPSPPKPTHGKGRKPYATVGDAIGGLTEEEALSMGCETLGAERKWIMGGVPPGKTWSCLSGERLEAALRLGRTVPNKPAVVRPVEFGRYSCDDVALTLTKTPRDNFMPIHPSATRPLSVVEFLRLQGVAQPFALCGSRTDKYALAGNGAPPQLTEAVSRVVAGRLASGRRGEADKPSDRKGARDEKA